MISNSKSFINKFVILNIMSNIESHSNPIALSTISNMKYFITNSVALDTTSNTKHSNAYLVTLITSSNTGSQNSNSVTMITSPNINPHNTNFITLTTRSNTKHLFDYYDSEESTSYEAQITLSIHEIKFLLCDYLDQTFIDILVDIAKHEVKIDYTKSSSKIHLHNHHFFYINTHIINQAIQKEL